MARRRAEQSGGTDREDWCTPDVVLDVARAIANGRIAYDPCGNPGSHVNAERETWLPRYSKQAFVFARAQIGDGLEIPFPLEGLTFVNHPYGREKRWDEEKGKPVAFGPNRNLLWAEKAAKEALRGAESLWLIPSAPGCQWWQTFWCGDLVCFVEGRLTFRGASQGADFESALIYWGESTEHAERELRKLGTVIRGGDVRWKTP